MSNNFSFNAIFAADKNGGIGKGNRLPWQGKLKTDMAFFKELTTSQTHYNVLNKFFKRPELKYMIEDPTTYKSVVIMGRKTWDSIPNKFKPLEDRVNIVLSRTVSQIEGAVCFDSLDKALASLQEDPTVGHIYVIGGSQVYEEAFKHPLCKTIFMTSIDQEFDCDTRLDLSSLGSFETILTSEPITESDISYTFKVMIRIKK